MKKVYTLVAVTFIFFAALHAQEKGNVEFRFDIGVNSSTVSSGSGNITTATDNKERTSQNLFC